MLHAGCPARDETCVMCCSLSMLVISCVDWRATFAKAGPKGHKHCTRGVCSCLVWIMVAILATLPVSYADESITLGESMTASDGIIREADMSPFRSCKIGMRKPNTGGVLLLDVGLPCTVAALMWICVGASLCFFSCAKPVMKERPHNRLCKASLSERTLVNFACWAFIVLWFAHMGLDNKTSLLEFVDNLHIRPETPPDDVLIVDDFECDCSYKTWEGTAEVDAEECWGSCTSISSCERQCSEERPWDHVTQEEFDYCVYECINTGYDSGQCGAHTLVHDVPEVEDCPEGLHCRNDENNIRKCIELQWEAEVPAMCTLIWLFTISPIPLCCCCACAVVEKRKDLCFDDMEICLWGTCCVAGLFGRTRAKAGLGNRSVGTFMFSAPILVYLSIVFADVHVTPTATEVHAHLEFLILAIVAQSVISGWNRNALQLRLGIQSDGAKNYVPYIPVVNFCCGPCAQCQEARAVRGWLENDKRPIVPQMPGSPPIQASDPVPIPVPNRGSGFRCASCLQIAFPTFCSYLRLGGFMFLVWWLYYSYSSDPLSPPEWNRPSNVTLGRVVMCSGNTDSTNDVLCDMGTQLIAAASTTEQGDKPQLACCELVHVHHPIVVTGTVVSSAVVSATTTIAPATAHIMTATASTGAANSAAGAGHSTGAGGSMLLVVGHFQTIAVLGSMAACINGTQSGGKSFTSFAKFFDLFNMHQPPPGFLKGADTILHNTPSDILMGNIYAICIFGLVSVTIREITVQVLQNYNVLPKSKIQAKDRSQWQKLFEEFNTDANGIALADVVAMFKRMDLTTTEDEIKVMFAGADKNKNGRIESFAKFRAAFDNFPPSLNLSAAVIPGLMFSYQGLSKSCTGVLFSEGPVETLELLTALTLYVGIIIGFPLTMWYAIRYWTTLNDGECTVKCMRLPAPTEKIRWNESAQQWECGDRKFLETYGEVLTKYAGSKHDGGDALDTAREGLRDLLCGAMKTCAGIDIEDPENESEPEAENEVESQGVCLKSSMRFAGDISDFPGPESDKRATFKQELAQAIVQWGGSDIVADVHVYAPEDQINTQHGEDGRIVFTNPFQHLDNDAEESAMVIDFAITVTTMTPVELEEFGESICKQANLAASSSSGFHVGDFAALLDPIGPFEQVASPEADTVDKLKDTFNKLKSATLISLDESVPQLWEILNKFILAHCAGLQGLLNGNERILLVIYAVVELVLMTLSRHYHNRNSVWCAKEDELSSLIIDSKSQWQKLFEEFNTDANGIALADVVTIVKRMDLSTTEDEIKAMFAGADRNKNGRIESFAKFCAAFCCDGDFYKYKPAPRQAHLVLKTTDDTGVQQQRPTVFRDTHGSYDQLTLKELLEEYALAKLRNEIAQSSMVQLTCSGVKLPLTLKSACSELSVLEWWRSKGIISYVDDLPTTETLVENEAYKLFVEQFSDCWSCIEKTPDDMEFIFRHADVREFDRRLDPEVVQQLFDEKIHPCDIYRARIHALFCVFAERTLEMPEGDETLEQATDRLWKRHLNRALVPLHLVPMHLDTQYADYKLRPLQNFADIPLSYSFCPEARLWQSEVLESTILQSVQDLQEKTYQLQEDQAKQLRRKLLRNPVLPLTTNSLQIAAKACHVVTIALPIVYCAFADFDPSYWMIGSSMLAAILGAMDTLPKTVGEVKRVWKIFFEAIATEMEKRRRDEERE